MPKKVLLVDDDADYLENERLAFEAAGFEVATAETLDTARTAAETERPDLAVVDLMLDAKDGGFALCHYIKKLNPKTPVIVVSAVTSDTGLDFEAVTQDERSWMKADAWLAKPVRFEQLQREVQRLLKD